MLRRRDILACLVLSLGLAGNAAADARLAEGGLPRRGEGPTALGPRPSALAPAALESRRLLERVGSELAVGAPARPKALGDRLILSLDDDRLPDFLVSGTEVDGEYEARLDVSGGVAGPSDWIAVRFPARDLAAGLPVRVNDVLLGLDDLNGATTWPVIEVWLENPAEPLVPRSGSASVAAPALDAVAAGLEPLPAGSHEPSRFARLRAGLPSGLDLPADWLSDAAFDDDFERFDQPLDDLAGLWLECEGDSCCETGSCPFTRSLHVDGMAVRRAAGATAATLAIRFPDPVVEGVRPAVDLDLRVSALIDVTDAAAGPAGLAVRALSTDAYYAVLVDPVPSPDEIVVVAVTPLGDVEIGREALVGDGGARLVEVEALGVNPAVSLTVRVDGNAHGPFTDALYRWAGSFSGLVTGAGASSGELWDDFRVQRRRDLFVTLQLPEGEDVGPALDVSEGSVAWGSVLLSTDGIDWTPRALGDPAYCFNPGNPFVQVEVEEIDAEGPLFQREARVVRLDLDCPTCPLTRNRCNENSASDERFPPLPTVGAPLSVRVGWWNEHLADDRLLLRATVLDASCDAFGSIVASSTFVAGDQPGQGPGEQARVSSVSGVLEFTPLLEGSYCLVIEELHDSNADCCADGLEAAGPFDDPLGVGACPGACTPAPASDSNPSTGVLVRDFQVLRACVPAAVESDMDGGSLRLSKTGGQDPVLTDLLFRDATRTVYNVHAMPARPFDPIACFEDIAPIFDRLVFSGPVGDEVRRTYEMPAPEDGRALWIAAFETDGCPAAASLPDSSSLDPALAACSP